MDAERAEESPGEQILRDMSVSAEAIVTTTSGKIEGTYNKGLYKFPGVPEELDTWKGMEPRR